MHPYLRAYMAGIFVPTLFVPVIFAFFCIARFVYHVDAPVERVIVFPLALVPNVWGLWNMLYLAIHQKRWPLGIHGAIVPLFLAPMALVVATAVGFQMPGFLITGMSIGLPVAVIAYYLVWKYFVGFFNQLLGVAWNAEPTRP